MMDERTDPGGLRSSGDGWFRAVDAAAVDWWSISDHAFPYAGGLSGPAA
jgi:hypothetical protein